MSAATDRIDKYAPVLRIDPLVRGVDCEAFMDCDEEANDPRERWLYYRAVRFDLSGLPWLRGRIRQAAGENWYTNPDLQTVTILAGWRSDGSSGASMDTPDIRLAWTLHDIACSKANGKYVVRDYFARHRLYRVLARAQGCPWLRAGWLWLGLILGNWAYALGYAIRNRLRPAGWRAE